MRWSEYTGALRPEQQECLANSLTLASAHASVAVRLMRASAPSASVLRSLRSARLALQLTRELLNAGPAPAPTPAEGDTRPREPWHLFIARIPAAEAVRLLALVSEAVTQSRRAVEAVIADGEVEVIRLHLAAATSAYADARDLIDLPLAS